MAAPCSDCGHTRPNQREAHTNLPQQRYHPIPLRVNPWSESSGPAEPPYLWEAGPLYPKEGWLGSGENIGSECTHVATCPGPADSGGRQAANRTS